LVDLDAGAVAAVCDSTRVHTCSTASAVLNLHRTSLRLLKNLPVNPFYLRTHREPDGRIGVVKRCLRTKAREQDNDLEETTYVRRQLRKHYPGLSAFTVTCLLLSLSASAP
jgi:hypothetical protein